MIDSRNIESLITDFNVEIIKAKRAETITEAATHLRTARECIKKLEKVIPEMKQEERDLTRALHSKLKSKNHD